MRRLVIHPAFIVGLAIRLALIAGLAPLAVTGWYVPFLSVSTAQFTLDPWSAWIALGGDPVAFPYGYAMWVTFLPLSIAAKIAGLPLLYAYDLTLLLADFSLLLVLNRLLPNRQQLLLLVYWLSPIIIVASYGLGLNDLVPALLLILSMLFMRRIELGRAGVFLATAISAKFSMVVALPFFAVYLLNNRALRQRSPEFLLGFGLTAIMFGGTFFLSEAGLKMLSGNPEMGKIYQLIIELTGNISVFVVPLVYLIVLYLAWRVRRLNFDLFQATVGMAFLLVVLLTPASPGWFVWCIPFLVLYQAMSGRMAVLLVGMFSWVYVLSTLLSSPIELSNGKKLLLDTSLHVSELFGGYATSLLYTAVVAIGGVLALRIWREAIGKNDFFRLSRKPFTIGVAGDSGAGKDTFSDAIAGLFGSHSVVRISGDDYHLWDRQRPMWQVMTHLNPMANDLEGFCNDLISLIDGRSILSKHYDHKTGKMGKPSSIRSNDFIIASGLHSFYLPILRECYDLKIYLNIDEGLRRYFKIRRDVLQRGHTIDWVTKSLEKTVPDSKQFIQPQIRYADLALSLQPIHPKMLDELDDKQLLRLKLVITTRDGFNELSLHRALVGICGLHVDVVVGDDGSNMQLTVEGEVSSSDIAVAARLLCPRVHEFLDISPEWRDGMLGLMQLMTLTHVNQALTKRFIR